MGLRHLSWMISSVHDESRTIPPRRRCARPTSRFTAAKSAPAGAAGHPGQHRLVAHLEETVATPEIKPPDEEFDEIGQDPVRHLLRPFAFTNSSKRAGTASGRRLRSAAVDSFNPTTRSSSATRSARSPTATVRPPSTTVSVSQPLRPAWPARQSGARRRCSVRPADRCDRWTHSGSTPPTRCISPVRLGPTSSARGTSSLGGQANYSTRSPLRPSR